MNYNIDKTKFSVIAAIIMLLGAIAGNISASEVTGTLSTGLNAAVGNTVTGTVISAPTANPPAGTYTAGQSVVLSASGSLNINYTVDGSIPNCAAGTIYSDVISVNKSQMITAIACFAGNTPSPLAQFSYVINLPVTSGGGGSRGNGSSSSVSIFGGGSGGGGQSSSSQSTVKTNSTTITPQVKGVSTVSLSIAEMEALIADLKRQIQAILTQLAAKGIKVSSGIVSLSGATNQIKQNWNHGQRSEEIKLIQALLAKDSQIYPEKIITGYFGNLTKAAIIRFQTKNGLTATGIVDTATRERLNLLF